MKLCKTCQVLKPLEAFRLQRASCKECCATYQRNHYIEVGHIVRQKKKDLTESSWVEYFKAIIYHKKRITTLSVQDLLDLYEEQEGLCAITKVPLTRIQGKGKVLTNLSLDRIEAGGPYIKSNLRLVCYIVNVMRHNLTDSELTWWCQKVVDETNN